MNPKLLIVDDERGIVDMIQSYFQTQYDILTAYSGQEALKKVACKPDLILLDINMPGMDGLTVCQQIREHIACPILFLTARIESSDKIIGFQAGADDYIVKPFDLDELGARIAAHLRREQRRQNNSAVRFFGELILDYSARTVRFLYKGIIIKHNKTEPTYTKTSLFLCEKRRFLWPGLRKEGNLFKLAGPGGLAFFHLTKKEVSKWPMKK